MIIKTLSAGGTPKVDLLEGRKTDPTFYPVIYGADMYDDWTDPKIWKKANPLLGITVTMDKVKAALNLQGKTLQKKTALDN